MSYIVIVDMNQPDIRRFVGLEAKDEFSLAEFDNISQVENPKEKHSLGVFEWIAVGVRDDFDTEVL